jgi:SAM-dependent methyltransferase
MIADYYGAADRRFLEHAFAQVGGIVGQEVLEAELATVRLKSGGVEPAVLHGGALWLMNKRLHDPRLRRRIARTLADLQSGLAGAPANAPTAEAREMAAALDTEGLVFLPNVLTESQISDVRQHLAASGRTTREHTVLHYAIEDVVQAPHVLNAVLAPWLLDVVTAYLGAPATLVDVSAWESLPGSDEPGGAQIFHRDRDDFRACKLFVYLDDVDTHSGPHVYARRSHDPDAMSEGLASKLFQSNGRDQASDIEAIFGERVVEITGPVGTSFLENTYGFHRGKVPTKGRRLILQAVYGLVPFPHRIERLIAGGASALPKHPSSRHAGRLAVPPVPDLTLDINVSDEDFAAICAHLRANPRDLLLIDAARDLIGRRRYKQALASGKLTITEDQAALWHDALQHNLDGLKSWGAVARTNRLARALSVIDRVFFGAQKLKVLSIGPRTEMELLALVAHGFAPQNIRGLDLFSYSPWIDVGNMHHMPYPEGSFDVVIAGWVLVYSSDPQQACREMLRVAKDRGIIAIGATRWPEERWRREGKGRTQQHYPGAWDVLEMFGSAVRTVYVQHDSESTDAEGRTIVVFEVSKGGGGEP